MSKVQIQARAQEVADHKGVIAMATRQEFRAKFGQIERLVKEHRSLSRALESFVQMGSDVREGLVDLSNLFNTFCNSLDDCMLINTITPKTLVKLMW